MQLTLFNGSPRGKKSNTAILLNHFVSGLNGNQEHQIDINYLIQTKDVEKHAACFKNAENVIIAFPLYTDAMPGIVKQFIEALEPLCGSEQNPRLGFIVQSGFPEPIHSRFVERYLEKLAGRLNCDYVGTVVRGGVEGIQIMPPWMTQKLFKHFDALGKYFAEHQTFDPVIMHKLAPRETLSLGRAQLFKIMQKSRLSNLYWDSQLKANNAFDRRFDQPYL